MDLLVQGVCFLCPSAIVLEAHRGHRQGGTASTQVTALASTFWKLFFRFLPVWQRNVAPSA